jgi:hypothetical protein
MTNHAQAALVAILVLGCGDQAAPKKVPIATSVAAAEDSGEVRDESTEEEDEGFAPPAAEAVCTPPPFIGAPADRIAAL